MVMFFFESIINNFISPIKFTKTKSYESKKTPIILRDSKDLFILTFNDSDCTVHRTNRSHGAKRGMTDRMGWMGWMVLTMLVQSYMMLLLRNGLVMLMDILFSLNVPEITDEIYYTGAVLVYKLIEIDPKSFNLLPYTYVDNAFFNNLYGL